MNGGKTDAVMLLGPTASGKTAAALAVAERIPCEIISIDSALVYRKMDIGTAKPTREELSVCPHHLIDIIEPTESYSAANFVSDAQRLIPEIQARGRLPLIVGGTMLYAKSLREGLSDLPSTPAGLREDMNRRIEEKGLAFLYEKLREVDPATASRLFPGDTQRITRAVEVYELTGRPMSSFFGESKGTEFSIKTMALLPEDRAWLHERIAVRFDAMLRAGFVDEVKELRKIPGLTNRHPSMRCVGYRQAWDYLDGLSDYDRFREAGIAATRQLAKRQITWLRSMKDLERLEVRDESAQARILEVCSEASAR